MSSADVETVLLKDERLMVTDKITYAVEKGGQNVNQQSFLATSQNPSSMIFNIQVPSETTLVDRRVLLQSTIKLAITGTAPVGQFLVDYGLKDALAPFPCHQLFSTQNCTINNNTVSQNTASIMDSLVRFWDRRSLARYNSYTPTAFDTVSDYTDLVGANNNSLGAWSNNADNDLVPRGSWVLNSISSSPSSVVPPVVSTGVSQTVYVEFTVSEPLLVSPFRWAHTYSNGQAMYGIQNMSFNFSIGSANRCWRSVPFNSVGAVEKTVSVYSVNDSSLLFNFLTGHPSDLLPSRNICAWYELPVYRTANLQAIGAYGSGTETATIRTSNIQLNQVPSQLVIYVRKSSGLKTVNDPDYFLTIKNVSIQWNNQSGLLASATPQDLFRYSCESGSNQSWYEFSGQANIHDPVSSGGKRVATSGSLLMLSMGKHVQITEDYYAPGSLINANLQIQLVVQNQTGYTFAPNELEIVLITKNDGIFVCERGTTSIFSGILDKNTVLDASQKPAVSREDTKILVGGGFLDTLKSVVGKVAPILPSVAKGVLSGVDNPLAKGAVAGLSALGYGKNKLSSRLM